MHHVPYVMHEMRLYRRTYVHYADTDNASMIRRKLDVDQSNGLQGYKD